MATITEQIASMIAAHGLATDRMDELLDAIAQLNAQVASIHCTAGGAANAITLAPQSAPFMTAAGHFDGLAVTFVAVADNTDDVTLKLGDLDAEPLLTHTGAELPAGMVKTGDRITAYWSEAEQAWLLAPWVGGHALRSAYAFTVIHGANTNLVNNTYTKVNGAPEFSLNYGGFVLDSGDVVVPPGAGGIYLVGHQTVHSGLNLTVYSGRIRATAGLAGGSGGVAQASDVTDEVTSSSRLITGAAIIDVQPGHHIWQEILQNRGSDGSSGQNSKLFGQRIG